MMDDLTLIETSNLRLIVQHMIKDTKEELKLSLLKRLAEMENNLDKLQQECAFVKLQHRNIRDEHDDLKIYQNTLTQRHECLEKEQENLQELYQSIQFGHDIIQEEQDRLNQNQEEMYHRQREDTRALNERQLSVEEIQEDLQSLILSVVEQISSCEDVSKKTTGIC